MSRYLIVLALAWQHLLPSQGLLAPPDFSGPWRPLTDGGNELPVPLDNFNILLSFGEEVEPGDEVYMELRESSSNNAILILNASEYEDEDLAPPFDHLGSEVVVHIKFDSLNSGAEVMSLAPNTSYYLYVEEDSFENEAGERLEGVASPAFTTFGDVGDLVSPRGLASSLLRPAPGSVINELLQISLYFDEAVQTGVAGALLEVTPPLRGLAGPSAISSFEFEFDADHIGKVHVRPVVPVREAGAVFNFSFEPGFVADALGNFVARSDEALGLTSYNVVVSANPLTVLRLSNSTFPTPPQTFSFQCLTADFPTYVARGSGRVGWQLNGTEAFSISEANAAFLGNMIIANPQGAANGTEPGQVYRLFVNASFARYFEGIVPGDEDLPEAWPAIFTIPGLSNSTGNGTLSFTGNASLNGSNDTEEAGPLDTVPPLLAAMRVDCDGDGDLEALDGESDVCDIDPSPDSELLWLDLIEPFLNGVPVAIGARLHLYFSEVVAFLPNGSISLESDEGDDANVTAVTSNITGCGVELIPELLPGRNYILTIENDTIVDMFGNSMQAMSFSFYTPQVVTMEFPTPGAFVASRLSMLFAFSGTPQPTPGYSGAGVRIAAASMESDGGFVDDVRLLPIGVESDLGVQAGASIQGNLLLVEPPRLLPNRTYQVSILAAAILNQVADFNFIIHTRNEDEVPPTPIVWFPGPEDVLPDTAEVAKVDIDMQALSVTFSERIRLVENLIVTVRCTSVCSDVMEIDTDDAECGDSDSPCLAVDGNRLSIFPQGMSHMGSWVTPDATYEVLLPAGLVTDELARGPTLANPSLAFSYSFTVSEGMRPTLLSMSPNSSTPLDQSTTSIYATFSEPVYPSTQYNMSISILAREASSKKPTLVSSSTQGDLLVLQFSQPLRIGDDDGELQFYDADNETDELLGSVSLSSSDVVIAGEYLFVDASAPSNGSDYYVVIENSSALETLLGVAVEDDIDTRSSESMSSSMELLYTTFDGYACLGSRTMPDVELFFSMPVEADSTGSMMAELVEVHDATAGERIVWSLPLLHGMLETCAPCGGFTCNERVAAGMDCPAIEAVFGCDCSRCASCNQTYNADLQIAFSQDLPNKLTFIGASLPEGNEGTASVPLLGGRFYILRLSGGPFGRDGVDLPFSTCKVIFDGGSQVSVHSPEALGLGEDGARRSFELHVNPAFLVDASRNRFLPGMPDLLAHDLTGPSLVPQDCFPVHNTSASTRENIVLAFSEAVKAGSGLFHFWDLQAVGDGELIGSPSFSVDVENMLISSVAGRKLINGNQASITPKTLCSVGASCSDLTSGITYFISTSDEGVLLDLAGNPLPALDTRNTYTFTVDVTKDLEPEVAMPGTSQVYFRESDVLVIGYMYFTERVLYHSSALIIRDCGIDYECGDFGESTSAPTGTVTFGDGSAIDGTSEYGMVRFEHSITYTTRRLQVSVPIDFVEDTEGNLGPTTVYSYIIDVGTIPVAAGAAPVLESSNPSNGTRRVQADTNVILTFAEQVQLGEGEVKFCTNPDAATAGCQVSMYQDGTEAVMNISNAVMFGRTIELFPPFEAALRKAGLVNMLLAGAATANLEEIGIVVAEEIAAAVSWLEVDDVTVNVNPVESDTTVEAAILPPCGYSPDLAVKLVTQSTSLLQSLSTALTALVGSTVQVGPLTAGGTPAELLRLFGTTSSSSSSSTSTMTSNTVSTTSTSTTTSSTTSSTTSTSTATSTSSSTSTSSANSRASATSTTSTSSSRSSESSTTSTSVTTVSTTSTLPSIFTLTSSTSSSTSLSSTTSTATTPYSATSTTSTSTSLSTTTSTATTRTSSTSTSTSTSSITSTSTSSLTSLVSTFTSTSSSTSTLTTGVATSKSTSTSTTTSSSTSSGVSTLSSTSTVSTAFTLTSTTSSMTSTSTSLSSTSTTSSSSTSTSSTTSQPTALSLTSTTSTSSSVSSSTSTATAGSTTTSTATTTSSSTSTLTSESSSSTTSVGSTSTSTMTSNTASSTSTSSSTTRLVTTVTSSSSSTSTSFTSPSSSSTSSTTSESSTSSTTSTQTSVSSTSSSTSTMTSRSSTSSSSSTSTTRFLTSTSTSTSTVTSGLVLEFTCHGNETRKRLAQGTYHYLHIPTGAILGLEGTDPASFVTGDFDYAIRVEEEDQDPPVVVAAFGPDPRGLVNVYFSEAVEPVGDFRPTLATADGEVLRIQTFSVEGNVMSFSADFEDGALYTILETVTLNGTGNFTGAFIRDLAGNPYVVSPGELQTQLFFPAGVVASGFVPANNSDVARTKDVITIEFGQPMRYGTGVVHICRMAEFLAEPSAECAGVESSPVLVELGNFSRDSSMVSSAVIVPTAVDADLVVGYVYSIKVDADSFLALDDGLFEGMLMYGIYQFESSLLRDTEPPYVLYAQATEDLRFDLGLPHNSILAGKGIIVQFSEEIEFGDNNAVEFRSSNGGSFCTSTTLGRCFPDTVCTEACGYTPAEESMQPSLQGIVKANRNTAIVLVLPDTAEVGRGYSLVLSEGFVVDRAGNPSIAVDGDTVGYVLQIANSTQVVPLPGPTVVATYPAAGVEWVPISTLVYITFDKAIVPASSGEMTINPGLISIHIMSCIFEAPFGLLCVLPVLLNVSTVYTVDIPSAYVLENETLSGNDAFSFSFRTTDVDVHRPVLEEDPMLQTVGHRDSELLSLRFSEPLQALRGSLRLSSCAVGNPRTCEMMENGTAQQEVLQDVNVRQPSPSDRLYIAGRHVFLGLSNLSDFDMNATYAVSGGGSIMADLSGNTLREFDVEFTTILEDDEPPVLLRVTPSSQMEVPGSESSPTTSIVLYFSEPVKVGTGGSIRVMDGEAVAAVIPVNNSDMFAGMVHIEGSQVNVKTYTDLAYSAQVTVEIDVGAFADLTGNDYLGNMLVEPTFQTRSPFSSTHELQVNLTLRLQPVFHLRPVVGGFIFYGGHAFDGSCLTDAWVSMDVETWTPALQGAVSPPVGTMTQSAVFSDGDVVILAAECGSSSATVSIYLGSGGFGTLQWTILPVPTAVPAGQFLSPAFPAEMSGHSIAVMKGWQLVVVNAATTDADAAGVWLFLDAALTYVARVARPQLAFGMRSQPGLHSDSRGRLYLLGGYRCTGVEGVDWSCTTPINDLWRSDDVGTTWEGLAAAFDTALSGTLYQYAHTMTLDDRLVIAGGRMTGNENDLNQSRSAYMTTNPVHETVILGHYLGTPRESPVAPSDVASISVYWREAIRLREGGPEVRLIDLGERFVPGGTGAEADTDVDASVSVENQVLIVTPEDTLAADRRFGVVVPTGAIEDLEGNTFEGSDTIPVFEFSTSSSGPSRRRRSVGDTTAPTLVDLQPESEASPEFELPSSSTLLLIFSENVQAGASGGLVLTPNYGDIVITLPASTAIIDEEYALFIPPDGLMPNEVYNISVDAGAFEDEAGNPYAGLTSRHVISTRGKIGFRLISDVFLEERDYGASGTVDYDNTLWFAAGRHGAEDVSFITSYETLGPIHCGFGAPHPGFATCTSTVCDPDLGIGIIPRDSRVFRAPDERAVHMCRWASEDPRRLQVDDHIAEFEDDRSICQCPLCIVQPANWEFFFEPVMGPFPIMEVGQRTDPLDCGEGLLPSHDVITCRNDTWYLGVVDADPVCTGEPCYEPPNLTLVDNILGLNPALSTGGLDCETLDFPAPFMRDGGVCRVRCEAGYTSNGTGFACVRGEFFAPECLLQVCNEQTPPRPAGGSWRCGENGGEEVQLGGYCLWQCIPGHLVVFPATTTETVTVTARPTTASTSTSSSTSTTESTVSGATGTVSSTSTVTSVSTTSTSTSTSTTGNTTLTTSTSTSITSTSSSSTTLTGDFDHFQTNNGQRRDCIVVGSDPEAPVSFEPPEVQCVKNDCGLFEVSPTEGWQITYNSDTLLYATVTIQCQPNHMGNVSDATGARISLLTFDLTCAATSSLPNTPGVAWMDGFGNEVTTAPCIPTACDEPQVINGTYAPLDNSVGTGKEWELTCNQGYFATGTVLATCQQNGYVSNVVSCVSGGCLGADASPSTGTTGTANGTTCSFYVEEEERCKATCSVGEAVGDFVCLFGSFIGSSVCVLDPQLINATALVGRFELNVTPAGLAPLPSATSTDFEQDILQAMAVALDVAEQAFSVFTTVASSRRLSSSSISTVAVRGSAGRRLTSRSVTAQISYELDIPADRTSDALKAAIEDLESATSATRQAFSSELARIDYVLLSFRLLSTPTPVVDQKEAPTPAPAAASDDSGLPTWVIVLLVILGVLALCCCCCFGGRMMKDS